MKDDTTGYGSILIMQVCSSNAKSNVQGTLCFASRRFKYLSSSSKADDKLFQLDGKERRVKNLLLLDDVAGFFSRFDHSCKQIYWVIL